MTLLTAHRILIATAAIFFFGFALWEFSRFLAGADSWAPARAVVYLLIAAGLGLYLRFMRFRLK